MASFSKFLLLLLVGLSLRSTAAAQRAPADSIFALIHNTRITRPKVVIDRDSTVSGVKQQWLRMEVYPGEWCTLLFTLGTKHQLQPLVIFQHWGGGRKEYFREEARALAKAGFNSVSIDAPWLWPTHDSSANGVREYPDNILRSAAALSCVVDYLEWSKHVATGRTFFIGHSYGATLGGLVLASEPRIRGAVFLAGLPNISASMEEDPLGQWKRVKEQMRGIYDTAVARLRVMEPEDFVGRSTAPVFYQAATNDEAVPKIYTDRYIKALGNRVDVKWYPTTHEFQNADAAKDRLAWLLRRDKMLRKKS